MEANLQTVQRAFQDFRKGDISSILEACADDVTWETYVNPTVPFAGTYEGRSGVRQYFSKIASELNYTAFTPREYCCQGDIVVALGRHIGKVKQTGKSFDHDWAMVFKFRDSKIYSCFCFVDTREQMEAFQGNIGEERREAMPNPAFKTNW